MLANNATFRLIEGALASGVRLAEVKGIESASCRLCFWALISLTSLHALQVYVDTVGEAGRHQARLAERFPGIRCSCGTNELGLSQRAYLITIKFNSYVKMMKASLYTAGSQSARRPIPYIPL